MSLVNEANTETQQFNSNLGCSDVNAQFLVLQKTMCTKLRENTSDLKTLLFRMFVGSFANFMVSVIVIGMFRPKPKQPKNGDREPEVRIKYVQKIKKKKKKNKDKDNGKGKSEEDENGE